MRTPGRPSLGVNQAYAASQRYRIEELLGQGGMAMVHRALDLESGRPVALKRLRPEMVLSDPACIGLFEREYLILSELAHPHVVRVHDYGVDEQGPYYTMELLDGGDLQRLAPLPWSRVCALGREVGSALALLHSRRMVYRDLSPRNVRCTSDGSAKLIDFGAMGPMGPMRELVGTAPCIAPEALNMQPLDARTDLFALGATLYFALVQRHAYPARDLSQLRDVWRSRPPRPSELVPGLPSALDQLVMDLLQLDRGLRPANAAEVLEKLSAISGERSLDQSLVAQAYLSSPNVVGREPQLSELRKRTFNALQQRGAGLLVTGAPGAGRSRLLDACVLEAKLAGLLVVRIDGNDWHDRADSSAARSIANSLLEAARPLALAAAEEHLPLLRSVIPELGERTSTAEGPDAAKADDAQLQHAIRSWVLAVSRRKPLLIAVDNFSALDERSAGLLAVLSEAAPRSGVLLVVTATDADVPLALRAALRVLESRTHKLTVAPLTQDEVQELLGSMFGDVPNLAALANYLHSVAGGNPRETMQIAQQLVLEGLIQYSGGAWSLPDRVRLNVLPASLRETFGAQARRLLPLSRRIALAFALEPTLRFNLEECSAFASELDSRELFRLLEDLVLADVLVRAGIRYGLRQQAWGDALLGTTEPALLREAQRILAEVLRARGDEFRASRHLFASGELARGLDLLLEHVDVTTRATESDANVFFDLLKQLPPDWLQIYDRALYACRELRRPARDAALLVSRIEGLASDANSDSSAFHHIQARLEQLSIDCGLDIFASLPENMDVVERMKAAFGAASARFESLPEQARVYAPGPAVKQYAQSLLSAIGVISFTHDFEALSKLPPIAPLAALFPAMSVVRDLAEGVGARITGRTERALAIYQALLSGVFTSAGKDLSRAYQTGARLRLVMSSAAMEAAMGLSRSIERLVEVEEHPTHQAQAMLVRHLYFAWQGDLIEADRCKRQAEVLQVHSSSHQGFEAQHLFSELCAYALCDDLSRVKHAADAIQARVSTHPAWKPILHYARGEFERIRGDLAAARTELETALSLRRAGELPIWTMIAGAHLHVCVELEDYQTAVELGETYLRDAEQAELGYACAYVSMRWSLALAHSGRCEEATLIAEQAIDTFLGLGTTGLNLGIAYETRARVALLAGELPQFELAKKCAAESWPRAEQRLLRALARNEKRPSLEYEVVEEDAAILKLVSELDACDSGLLRAERGLAFVVERSGAEGGLLYLSGESGLARAAVVGAAQPDEALDARALEYWRQQVEEDETTDMEGLGDTPSVRDAGAPESAEVTPVLLMHRSAQGTCITGVALLFAADSAAYRHPARLVGELSRCLADHGDVSPIESC